MLEVYSIGNESECMKTLSWKYTPMVREGLIYNETVYMIFQVRLLSLYLTQAYRVIYWKYFQNTYKQGDEARIKVWKGYS